MDKTSARRLLLIVLTSILFAVSLLHLDKVWGVLRWGFDAILPVVLGLCIAFVMCPFVRALERLFLKLGRKETPVRRRIARGAAVLLSFTAVFGALTLLAVAVAPQVSEAVTIVGQRLPGMVDGVLEKFNALAARYALPVEPLAIERVDWDKTVQAVLGFLRPGEGTTLLAGAADAAVSLLGGVFDALLAVIVSCYVLMQRDSVGRFFTRLIRAYASPRRADAVLEFLTLTNTAFRRFVTGQVIEAVIIGVLCFLGMLLFRFPYAAATSAIIAVTALVPVFGAWFGGAVGALFVLTDSPMLALLFVVYILVLQQLEGNLIYPKVVGTSMGLPGLLVLVAVIIGGSVGGIVGMLLSVPLCAIAYTLVKRGIDRRLRRRAAQSDPPA